MAKFKVGDRARLILPKDEAHNQECTIIAVGYISNHGNSADYEVKFLNSSFDHEECITWGVDEEHLEPIIDLGSWDELQKTINWNPTKETAHVQ